ncbi:MAG: cysteine desulfurase [Verrucomicrobia bacterium]|nr:cysteine desulfurase [Verrucomicrobiota bacterium]MCH8512237.1 cysteine desulfurase [Kiritimatiellia bacterium]
MIYADYNATTPCLPEAARLMTRMLCDDFGNPSNRASLFGRTARGAIDLGREQVARAVGAFADEVIFTSGATEACNMAIFGVMERLMRDRPRILTSAIEHPAVCMPAEACASAGAEWIEIPVDGQGRLDLAALSKELEHPTAMVCVMAANNETGVMQDLPAVVKLAHDAGALVFCDMTQLLGKVPFSVHTEQVDFACFSAHKCYGPKGIGALYKRRGLALSPLLRGGGQESGLRSGTENVPAIAAFGLVADLAAREVNARRAHLQKLTAQLESEVCRQIPGVVVQSAKAERIPGTSMFSCPGLRGKWLSQLSGIVASSGSACASMQEKPSHVLQSMGVDDETAAQSIRISLGMPSTTGEVRQISQALAKGAEKLR